MGQRIIFFDIDGTLLSPIHHEFEASTKEALIQLREKGFLLGIATGRGYQSSAKVGAVDLIDWDMMVFNNGQKVLDKNHQVIFSQPIDHDIVKRFIDKAHEKNIAVMGQGDGWHFYSELNDYVHEVHQYLQDLPVAEKYSDQHEIYTLMIYGYDDSFMDEFDELRSIGMETPYFDVVLKGAHKAHGILEGLKKLNLKPEYIAMGDSLNDLEMAQQAQTFISTHEAVKELQDIATYVVESPFDEIKKATQWLIENEI